MVGIDGRPMSDHERHYLHLRGLILGCTDLTFNISNGTGLSGLPGSQRTFWRRTWAILQSKSKPLSPPAHGRFWTGCTLRNFSKPIETPRAFSVVSTVAG